MKAVHVLSHNAVVIRDEYGKRCVLTGKGIGFRKNPGDRIDRELIQNIFIEDSNYARHLTVVNH